MAATDAAFEDEEEPDDAERIMGQSRGRGAEKLVEQNFVDGVITSDDI